MSGPPRLNKAIQRSHFPLPTIEQVAAQLNKAKVFTTGLWQVKLDQQSSYLTTLVILWEVPLVRMPFGINSAPEVWQQRMTQIVEGLNQVEMIADDFLIYGVGDTTEEAMTNHDLVL